MLASGVNDYASMKSQESLSNALIKPLKPETTAISNKFCAVENEVVFSFHL